MCMHSQRVTRHRRAWVQLGITTGFRELLNREGHEFTRADHGNDSSASAVGDASQKQTADSSGMNPFQMATPMRNVRTQAQLSARNRANHQKRLFPGHNLIRQRIVRRVMGQVLLASKESQERPPLFGDVIADRPTQHGITLFERIQHRPSGHRRGHFKRDLAADVSQIAKVVRKNDADHGYELDAVRQATCPWIFVAGQLTLDGALPSSTIAIPTTTSSK